MRYLSFIFFALCLAGTACSTQQESQPAPIQVPKPGPVVAKEYVFSAAPVWQDEFDYTGKPDSLKWGYDLGGDGWGNNELQNYTNKLENARVKDGQLVITAIREPSGKQQFSSARLITKGKGDFLYGRIEVKAKLPSGLGTWPAIWMLATDNIYGTQYWPDNGEIDIMEHVGFDQDNVHANIHTKAFNHSIGTNKGNEIKVPNASTEFHVYACEWKPDYLAFFVDGKQYFRFDNASSYNWSQWPFDRKQFLLLNIAIGGNWGGQKGVDGGVLPQSMTVDYVRVYGLEEKK